MNKISIIIPVHKFEKKFLELALKTMENQSNKSFDTVIVHPKDLTLPKDFFLDFESLNITFISHNKDISYSTQVNHAVENITTDYFSVLQYDDKLNENYVERTLEYIENYPEKSVFMPIVLDCISDNGVDKFNGFSNESTWAKNVCDELGVLDLEMAKGAFYTNLSFTGAILKKECFEKVGKLKKELEPFGCYELMLRMANNNLGFLTIPKVMYVHLHRKDTLSADAKNKMNEEERRSAFLKATEEYIF